MENPPGIPGTGKGLITVGYCGTDRQTDATRAENCEGIVIVH